MSDEKALSLAAHIRKQLDEANESLHKAHAYIKELEREVDIQTTRRRVAEEELNAIKPPEGRVHSLAVARSLVKPTDPKDAA